MVWLAEDTRIARRVALKILTGLGPGSEAVLHRFHREAEVTSRLEHPAICPIYEVELQGDVPFIAMRFVEGQTLARRIAETKAAGGHAVMLGDGVAAGRAPDFGAIATFFAKAARALHLAHEAGVIHRDIKPANMMVTPEGEPVILDFGLAGHADPEAHALSASGSHSGTPTYMSPEQVTGRARPDRRSDVYSLGCTLFESLTGQPPFVGATLEALFHAILATEAPDARALHAGLPFDLRVIATTAIQKDPERRYKSALDLAEDLERFVRLEPIAARPIGRLQRAARWCRRNPSLAASFFALVGLVLLATGLLSYGIGASGRAALQAELREQADQARELAVAEQQRMVQAAADRDLAGRIDELQMKLGTLIYGIPGGQAAIPSLLPAFMKLLREAGIDLSATDAAAARRNDAAVRALAARDADAGRALLAALDNLASVEGLEAKERENVSAVLASFQTPWEAELVALQREYEGERVDGFDALLSEEALADRTPDELAALGSALLTIPGREATAFELLDRALIEMPDSFSIHFMRAGISLQRAAMNFRNPQGSELLAQAVEHFRVAMALRPRSGLTRSALAGALAMRAQMRGGADEEFIGAWELMDSATKVDPDNALAWYFRADFLRRTPNGTEDAIAACRKALELDPALVLAKNLLDELSR